MRILQLTIIVLLLATIGCGKRSTKEAEVKPPNIVLILADDLGYGDLSCYGQTKFTTPNIDALAAEGLRFTQAYAGSPVCAPSRSALFTGLHTGHTPIRGNKGWKDEGQWPLPDSAFTLTELLKAQGYATGVFGKWGLGFIDTEGNPNDQGVDEFFGYNCQSLAHNYYPHHLWHNKTKIDYPDNSGTARDVYAPDVIHGMALDFIEAHKEQPFFLFYPTTLPHAELLAPESYMAKYRGKFGTETPYTGVDDGQRLKKGPYGSQPEPHAAFAAMVNYLDDRVGELMRMLKESGLDDNTIIIFTSDNGPHLEGGADPDYFDSNGMFRGYKRDVYEGGIRVPLIIRWPSKINMPTTTDWPVAFWDVMPTLGELIKASIPDHLDGVSFHTLLEGSTPNKKPTLYWEFHEQGGKAAIREGNWKLVITNLFDESNSRVELFDIHADPQELSDRSMEHPELVAELRARIKEQHSPSAVFPFPNEGANDLQDH